MAKKLRKLNEDHQYLLIASSLILLFVVLIMLSCFAYGTSLFNTVSSLSKGCLENVSCMSELEETIQLRTFIFAVVLAIFCIVGLTCFIFIFSGRSKNVENKQRDLTALTNGIASGIVKVKKYNGLYTMVYANDGFYRMLGYSRKEYRNKFNEDIMACVYADDLTGMKEILSESSGKDKITMEFRIVNKFAQVRWLLMNAVRQGEYYLCTFMDVTKSKAIEDEVQLNNERLQFVLENMKDMIFEYNFMTRELSPIANMESLKWMTSYNDFVSHNLLSKHDKEKASQLIENAKNGKTYQVARFRAMDEHEVWAWYELELTTLFDRLNVPCRVLGRLTNIDTQMREKEMLIEISQKDPMTQLLNKTVAEELVEDFIVTGGKMGALLLIDIDDFKSINDTFGHACGDKVIKFLADTLNHLFRQYDIVSRIGGDEFMVFMKSCDSVDKVLEKANALNQTLSDFHVDGHDFHVSTSIGCAFYPTAGETYEELVEKADMAMYVGKRNGKKHIEFYNESMN